MVKLPIKFEVEAKATAPITASWTSRTDGETPIDCSIPAEFMGPGTGYSPEDLFSLAILNCIIAMFKFTCQRGHSTFREIHGKAIATLDGAPAQGTLMITDIEIFLEVTGASDIPKVKHLLEAAIKECPISHSIKSGKTFHINIA